MTSTLPPTPRSTASCAAAISSRPNRWARQPAQRPGAERGADVHHRLVQGGRRDAVEQDEPEHDVGRHARAHRQHRVGRLGRVAHGGGAHPADRQVEREVGAERHLDDAVHRPARGRPDLAGRVRLPVVDHVRGARLLGQLRLGRATRGGDDRLRPAPDRELDGEVPDRARTAGHQHGAAPHRAVGQHAVVPGHRGHPQAGTELEGHRVGQRHGLALRHHGPFRRGPPAPPVGREPDPDPLADPAGRPARPDRVDHSGAVVVRDLETVDRARGHPGAGLHVGGVDAGRVHPDPDLARPRLRPLHLGHPQHLGGGTGAVIAGGSHVVRLLDAPGLIPRHYRPWPGATSKNTGGGVLAPARAG